MLQVDTSAAESPEQMTQQLIALAQHLMETAQQQVCALEHYVTYLVTVMTSHWSRILTPTRSPTRSLRQVIRAAAQHVTCTHIVLLPAYRIDTLVILYRWMKYE
jgi:hypothetical protein